MARITKAQKAEQAKAQKIEEILAPLQDEAQGLRETLRAFVAFLLQDRNPPEEIDGITWENWAQNEFDKALGDIAKEIGVSWREIEWNQPEPSRLRSLCEGIAYDLAVYEGITWIPAYA